MAQPNRAGFGRRVSAANMVITRQDYLYCEGRGEDLSNNQCITWKCLNEDLDACMTCGEEVKDPHWFCPWCFNCPCLHCEIYKP